MADRDDIEELLDAVDQQVDFDLAKVEAKRCVLEGRAFTADELLDIWNENDLYDED